ncbi:MAG TPA: DegV family protein [Dehalococcoidales bacterium]|nr:DegV family protein [Dehalococcoidales bacterium]
MAKVGVVADTAASIPEDLIKKYGITMVPLITVFEDKSYRDGIDLKEASQLFDLVNKADKFPSSSAPPPADYLDLYRKLAQDKVDGILSITISTGLSVCFDSATQAKQMAKKELPGVRVEVLDSKTTLGGFGMIVLAAARAAAEGKDLDQVIKAASEVKDKLNCIILFDTLSYLAKSGRIGRANALMGTILSIKPIAEIPPSIGTVEPVTRVRTRPKALKYLLEIVRRRSKPGDKIHFLVEHTVTAEEAKKLIKMLNEEFDCAEILSCDTQPVAALKIGPKSIGLTFYSN